MRRALLVSLMLLAGCGGADTPKKPKTPEHPRPSTAPLKTKAAVMGTLTNYYQVFLKGKGEACSYLTSDARRELSKQLFPQYAPTSCSLAVRNYHHQVTSSERKLVAGRLKQLKLAGKGEFKGGQAILTGPQHRLSFSLKGRHWQLEEGYSLLSVPRVP